jgi:adenylate cyclase
MLSEDTLQEAGDGFIVRELGLIAVKGKLKPVRIYELLASRATASTELVAWVGEYTLAIELYYQGKWQQAHELFKTVLMKKPGDGPAGYYLERCRIFLQNPPLTDDWNVIHMKEK